MVNHMARIDGDRDRDRESISSTCRTNVVVVVVVVVVSFCLHANETCEYPEYYVGIGSSRTENTRSPFYCVG